MALKFRNFMDFKKSRLIFKVIVLTIAFIMLGNLIAYQTGITNQLSKIFYWPDKGLVAGEYEVRAAQASGPNFNPPYPRIGQMYLYGIGQGAEIWHKHKLIMIRHWYDKEGALIKQKNPNAILLAANDRLVAHKNDFPDDWYILCNEGSGCQGGKLNSYHQDFGLLNITPVSPTPVNQLLPQWLVNHTNFNVFDGSIFDYWARQIWSGADIASINGDLTPDGSDYVNRQWELGNQALIKNFRAFSNKPILSNEGSQTYLNGNMFEFWSQNENKKFYLNSIFNLQDRAVRPVINYTNSDTIEENGVGAHWRVDFTLSQIAGAFIGHDEGTSAHRFTYLHDEYEANLGYPLAANGEPQQLSDNVWVRYFDNGVVIANISGSRTQITANQLRGGPYWRFLGAQNNSFNNGAQFNNVTLEGYDGIMLFLKPTTLITPIIIDNVAINMTSLGQQPVSYSANWRQVRWPDNAEKSNTGYGLGIFWGNEENIYAVTSSAGTATYQAKISVPGKYRIDEWHPNTQADGQGQGCSNVSVSISGANCSSWNNSVNQTQKTGQWNELGTCTISSNQATITLTAPGSCTTASDAIRLVNLSSQSSNRYLTSDFNCDNQVNIQDFGILLSHWQKQGQDLMNYQHSNCGEKRPIEIAPMNNSCALTSAKPIIDAVDMGMLLSCWGAPTDDGVGCCWSK